MKNWNEVYVKGLPVFIQDRSAIAAELFVRKPGGAGTQEICETINGVTRIAANAQAFDFNLAPQLPDYIEIVRRSDENNNEVF